MNTQTSYFKKALVVLMAVIMVFTMMPGMVWAANGTDTGGEQTTTDLSGTCGSDAVTYTLYSDGRLVIRGTGSIEKGTWENSIKTKVKEISIDGNITTIGKMAFMSYSNLRSVNLGSITSIDMAAFNGCSNLETIQADSVTKIGSSVFNNCKKIKTISLRALFRYQRRTD